ncbi:MAG: hypothetical protein ACXABY_31860 [Candidatus Thorarchaeota archaeon]|jgi:hypothetical protein
MFGWLTGFFRNYSNCLIYAKQKYDKEGGWIVMRKSHYGWWPHFLHLSKDMKLTQYTLHGKRKRIIPPLVFKGFVKLGDNGEDK